MSTTTRSRAVAIVFRKSADGGEEILVTFRRNFGEEYHTFPGGGIELYETDAVACVRELAEEASVVGMVREKLGTVESTITKNRILAQGSTLRRVVNEVFIVDYVSGTPKLAHDSPEQKKVAEGGSAGNQEYTPQWMSVDAFMKLNDVLPAEVGDAVRAYLERRAMEAHK